MLKRSSLLTSLSFFCSPCQKCKRQPLWLVRCSKSEIARKLLITQNRKNYQKRKKRIVSKNKTLFFSQREPFLTRSRQNWRRLAEERRSWSAPGEQFGYQHIDCYLGHYLGQPFLLPTLSLLTPWLSPLCQQFGSQQFGCQHFGSQQFGCH